MLKIANDVIYNLPLEKKHRFPMLKYELLPEFLIKEGTCADDNFFCPGDICDEDILLTHNKSYYHNLLNFNLNKQEFKINEKHRNFMMEIFSQEKFKSISFFKHSQIIEDFSKNINIPILWELCKHYLMITGFEKNLNNINLLKPSPESFNYLSDTS